MQYESAAEKATMVPGQMRPPLTKEDFDRNPDIRNARTRVIIVLGIQLVLIVLYCIRQIQAIITIVSILTQLHGGELPDGFTFRILYALFAAVAPVIYISAYLTVVVKYIRIGILVFAWLCLIELIGVFILIIIVIIMVITGTAIAGYAEVGIIIGVIVIIVTGLASILLILTIIFSFKLTNLMKIQEDGYLASNYYV